LFASDAPKFFAIVLLAILQLLLPAHNAHASQRIWQLSSAIDTTDVSKSSTVTARPRGAGMNAVKDESPNPFQPTHLSS